MLKLLGRVEFIIKVPKIAIDMLYFIFSSRMDNYLVIYSSVLSATYFNRTPIVLINRKTTFSGGEGAMEKQM